VASWRSRINQAAALHRQAAALTMAATTTLEGLASAPRDLSDRAEQRELAERLRALAPRLAPGWLGATLRPMPATHPTGGRYQPTFVRIGTAQPFDDVTFPVVVPLLGTGHLAFDADARDPRVAGALRALLLRLFAATPPGSLVVRAVDAAAAGLTFAPFAQLAEAGLMPPPVTDRAGLQTILTEAELWVRPDAPAAPRPRRGFRDDARPPLTGASFDGAGGPDGPQRLGGRSRPDRTMLLVIASLPELTEGAELARIAGLAQAGPAAGLHLVVAGWPPPPLTAETTQHPLPLTTQVWLRNPYALVGDPPGGGFGAPVRPGGPPPTGLNSQVYLDDDPPFPVIGEVCREIAARAAAQDRLSLTDVLPDAANGVWTRDAAEELTTTVGLAGESPLVLRFNDLTPHWMIGGRSGAGKTAFLINVLYGVCTSYGPDELALYLLDFKEGVSFAEFTPTERDPSWLPHARAIGAESDREFGLAVLRELDAEMSRRAVAYKQAGVTRFADLRAHQDGGPSAPDGTDQRLPRILCVIDEFQVLLAGADRIAADAVGLLESLARKGRSYGIHLILASQTIRGVEALYAKRDSIFGQFPVRIALPGGEDVLEPTNAAAAGLPLGAAVVNTAGGLGGPRGATRGHEKLIHFPDPHTDQPTLTALRRLLWKHRSDAAPPPTIFEGYAYQHLADDPTYQGMRPVRGQRRTALLGRVVDARLSTAAFPLDTSPGRHLAVLGPSELGVDLLDAAARSLALQHPPGTANFLIASLVATGDPAARRLAGDLAAAGHSVLTVNAAGLGEIIEEYSGSPGGIGEQLTLALPGAATPETNTAMNYLVVFGMDAAPGLRRDRLRELLRDGPAHGTHLLAWWRGLGRFNEQTGGSAGRDDVAGLVFLNLPASDASVLLGTPVDWQPRPNRALLYDRHTGELTVIVPFARPERAS
jgi:S-DNA-T family DNA segregation ATPase FtsK/SpoIIIE